MRRYLTTLFTVAIATVAALAATVGATPTAAASTSYASDTRGVGPEIRGFQAAFAYPFPEAAPAGANDWACRPTPPILDRLFWSMAPGRARSARSPVCPLPSSAPDSASSHRITAVAASRRAAHCR